MSNIHPLAFHFSFSELNKVREELRIAFELRNDLSLKLDEAIFPKNFCSFGRKYIQFFENRPFTCSSLFVFNFFFQLSYVTML